MQSYYKFQDGLKYWEEKGFYIIKEGEFEEGEKKEINKHIYDFLDCKKFEISESVKNALSITVPIYKKHITMLPFPNCFFDIKIKINENRYLEGILIQEEGYGYEDWGEKINERVGRYYIFSFLTDGEGKFLYIVKLCLNFNYKSEKLNKNDLEPDLENILENNKELKIIRDNIANLLLFINDPRVKLVENKRGKKNIKRRLKNNKRVIPNTITTILNGELTRYLKEFRKNKQNINFNYKFWVKGHWREYKSKRYKNMKGKLKWILPYIKGKGNLIPQTFQLRANKTIQKCEICSYKLTDIHHKNKNHSDNRIKNLIELCPNCHAQIHRKGKTLEELKLKHQ